jgi:hypothetical protein
MDYTKKPSGDIGKAMTYKQEGIEKAQRSTQDSIRVSGSATDATLMVVALMQFSKDDNWTRDTIKDEWEHWRKYFFEKRNIEETFKELTQPF